MKIRCRTLFDCTTTGTTGSFRPSQVPYQDHSGADIVDQITWNRSRNQQRNWETLLQILQLRSQIEEVTHSQQQDGAWYFTFAVDNVQVYGDDFVSLYQDAAGVPMTTGLGEVTNIKDVLICTGTDQNIWFTPINT